MRTTRLAAVIGGMALAAVTAFPASASDVAVSGGSLAFTGTPSAGDFQALTLDGTSKTTTATLATFEVNDSRGTGAGWNVTVQATQFKEWDAGTSSFVTGGKTLPTSSLAMAQPTVTADGTDSAAPSVTSGPYTIDAGSAVKIASAAADAGMGKYDFGASTLTLTVPASAYAKNYRSTVTVSINSGP